MPATFSVTKYSSLARSCKCAGSNSVGYDPGNLLRTRTRNNEDSQKWSALRSFGRRKPSRLSRRVSCRNRWLLL